MRVVMLSFLGLLLFSSCYLGPRPTVEILRASVDQEYGDVTVRYRIDNETDQPIPALTITFRAHLIEAETGKEYIDDFEGLSEPVPPGYSFQGMTMTVYYLHVDIGAVDAAKSWMEVVSWVRF